MPLTNCTATPPTVEDNSMRTPFGQFADICRMIKIEHSVFALPYAPPGLFWLRGACCRCAV